MADLRTGDMRRDCRGGPWPSVRDLKHCSACLGALPPDRPDACSSCGRDHGGGEVVELLSEAALERERLARAGRRPDRLAVTPGAGWGSADIGSAWTTTAAAGSDFSTTGSNALPQSWWKRVWGGRRG